VDVAIRRARLDDAEAVVRVHELASAAQLEELIGKSLDELLPLEDRLEACRRDLEEQSREAETLVAEWGGQVVGMVRWRLLHPVVGEVEDLHVVPDVWGTGVASRLLDAAVLALRGTSAETVFLWVGETNARARRFYEREGWEYDGTSQPSAFGPTELRYRLMPISPRAPA
jgi:GNAT superfamily N-acetyltransferase